MRCLLMSELPHCFKRVIQIELTVPPLPVRILHGLWAYRTEDQKAFDLERVDAGDFLDIKDPLQHQRHSSGCDSG